MTCKDCIHYENHMSCIGCVREDYYNSKNKGMENYFYFKDKSKFIELPCHLKDIVFVTPTEINRFDEITRMECLGFQIAKPNPVVDLFRKENGKSSKMYQPGFDSFGEEVFFTKEEAEKKLKELSNNDL